MLGIGEYKYLLPEVIFSSARKICSCSHSSLSLAAPLRFLGGHHSTEDVNKPDMLLLKLALNF